MNEIFIDGGRVPIEKISVNIEYDMEHVPEEYDVMKTTIFGAPRWIPVARDRHNTVPYIVGEEICGEIELTAGGWGQADPPESDCVDIETELCILKDVFFTEFEVRTDAPPTVSYVARRIIPKDEIPAE